MSHTSIAVDVHESFYVTDDGSSEVTFDFVVVLDDGGEGIDLFVGQIVDADVGADAGLFEELFGDGGSDAVDALEADLDAFAFWEVNSD